MNPTIARSRDSWWSDLPVDLLTIIGNRLNTRIDILRLRAVCWSWRSTIPIYNNASLHLPMDLPYLGDYDDFVIPLVQVPTATLTETILYRIEPLGHGGQGWLIKVNEVRPNEFRLLNYDASKISFPFNLNLLDYRVFELGKSYVFTECISPAKTIFSAEHRSLLLLLDGIVSLFRFGDKKWTNRILIERCKDIIMYKGEFHAIDDFGNLFCINGSNLNKTRISSFLFYTYSWASSEGFFVIGSHHKLMHLLQGFGDLYLVVRPLNQRRGAMYYDMELNQYIYNDGRCIKKMDDIKIYKLNEEGKDWVKVESLVDKVIIVSVNDSVFASAEELAGFSGNCIYFADQDYFFERARKRVELRKGRGFVDLEDHEFVRMDTDP